MLILIDKKMPHPAKLRLQQYGQIIELETNGIVYNAISGHPDIFFFQHPGGLIVAPNLPDNFKKKLHEEGIELTYGEKLVGREYPNTAHYNALWTPYGILHNKKVTESTILSTHSQLIDCRQAYTRCNAVSAGDIVLTSDKGIKKVLISQKIPFYYINPQSIVLPGLQNGFFGGCCGIHVNDFFVCGNLNFIEDGLEITHIIKRAGFRIVELYEGPLFDVGGILFVDRNRL